MTTVVEQINAQAEQDYQVARWIIRATWGVFLLSCLVALGFIPLPEFFQQRGWIQLDGLTRVTWPYVTLLTVVILSFAHRYLAGDSHYRRFFLVSIIFMFAVMGLASTDHLGWLLFFWLVMQGAMILLISYKSSWYQARSASRLAFRYFLVGGLFLMGAIGLFVLGSGSWRISRVLAFVGELPPFIRYGGAIGLLVAAFIQSALYPLQNWLMSSMTAATPASALMHAGFVNVGGILLTRFAVLFAELPNVLLVVLIVGAVSAILGKLWKRVQPVYKRQLGCSTVGQMGFMIVQCGLGFFTAALTHLILHGFYKSYAFLATGAAVESTVPEEHQPKTRPRTLLLGLFWAALGGLWFTWITGKGTSLDGGLVLTAVVMMALLHGCLYLLDNPRLPTWLQHLGFPLVLFLLTTVYGLAFNGVGYVLADVPAAESPVTLSPIHGLVLMAFLGVYIAIETGWARRLDFLYVWLLNAGQPDPSTILASKEEYNVH